MTRHYYIMLPSSVFILVEVSWLCCEQHGRGPAELRILSLVAGGPVRRCPRKAVGLVGPGPQGPKLPMAPMR